MLPRPPQEIVDVPTRHKGTLEENFELLRLIERGGFGAVFIYKSRNNLKFYAIKNIVIDEDNRLEECEREVRYRHVLKHKNLIECIAVWKEILSSQITTLYIQMEYCPCGSLRQAITRGDFRLVRRRIFTVLEGTLLGLEFLHYHKFIHRDIKPENIVLNQWGLPKIVDFGLIKSLVSHSRRTALTEGVGTDLYKAPEVFGWVQNHLCYTTKVDIFSLGVVFFGIFLSLEIFTNVERVAFIEDLRMKIISFAIRCNSIVWILFSSKPIPLPPILGRNLSKGMSKAVFQLLRNMLEPLPERRYSASELLEGAELIVLKQLTAPVGLSINRHSLSGAISNGR